MIRRSVLAVVAVGALVAATFLVAVEVRQDREFRRLVVVGDAALAERQTFQAIESFSGALALKPDSMVAYLKRGDAYLARGEYPEALRDLTRAAELDGMAPQPIERLGDLHAAVGRHARAVEQYGRYLSLDDRSPRVMYKLALSRVHLGAHAEAKAALDHALDLDERMAEAHHLLGVSLRAQQDLEGARVALVRAIEIDRAFVAAREELADLYGALGRRREQVEQLEAIAALEPQQPARQVAVALAHAASGHADRAVATLASALERNPESPALDIALGRIWLGAADRGDSSAAGKALDALAAVASRKDASGEALSLYGRALLLADRVAEAEQMLQRAIGQLPVDPQAFVDLAEAARRLGHDETVQEAEARHAALDEGR